MKWKLVSDKNNIPEVGKNYLVTIWKRGYGDDDVRVVTIGQYNYNTFSKTPIWDHEDRMISYAELPEPYTKELYDALTNLF
jgi:hypothetical protein